MAIVWNPRSELIREPNLLVPGKKPIGPVKINWSHPDTKGLIASILCGDGPPRELVTGAIGAIAETDGDLYNSADGQGTHTKKTTGGSNTKVWRIPFNYTFGDYVTIFVAAKWDGTAEHYHCMLSLNNSDSSHEAGFYLFYGLGTKAMRFVPISEGDANSGASEDYHIYSVTSKASLGNANCYYYKDGKDVGSVSGTASITTAITNIRIMGTANWKNNDFFGNVYAAHVYDGFLDAAAHRRIAKDFYSFWIPA